MDSLLKIANNNSNNNNPKATTAAAAPTTTSGRIVAADDSLVPSLYNDNDLLVIDASIKPLVPGLLDNLDSTPSGTTNTTVTNNGLSK